MSEPLTDGYLELVRGIGYARPTRPSGGYWLPETEAEIDLTRQAEALEAARVSLLAEVDRLRLSTAGLHARITELEVARTAAAADRDTQIIAWLEKKAGEYGTSNRENRAKAEAVSRMADKLSRGAVRPACPPVSAQPKPDAIEYGIRLTPDSPESEVLKYLGYGRSAVEERLARHRTGHPDARLLQRTVHHGQWTDTAAS
jgi:hypothetical protein